MKKRIFFQNLPLFLLVVAIVFSPELYTGAYAGEKPIVIRIEDALLVILGLIWTANFLISGKRKIEKPPLFFPILVWLGVGLISILTNWIFMNTGISRAFFFFLKEIEFFFLYFYLFYHLKNIESVKFMVNSWIVLGVLAIALIIVQFNAKLSYGSYGPGLFMEKGPFPSGGFFLILFANLLNIFLYYYSYLNISKIKKLILALLISSLIVGIVGSGSRTSIIGAVFVVFLSFFLYFLREKKLKVFFVSLAMFIIFGGIIFFIGEKAPRGVFLEQERAIWNPKAVLAMMKSGRAFAWKAQLKAFSQRSPLYIFFGLGKATTVLAYQESHSQYVRNLVETGIIGSFVFLILIFSIIKKSWKGFKTKGNPFASGMSAGLLVATFTMLFVSIAVGAFIVVRPSEVYWFFTAITIATLSFNKK